MRGKYKRLTDLFVVGTVVELDGDDVCWVQALNPYERDEALHDAQVARARVIMALGDASDERLKVESRMQEVGRDKLIEEIASSKTQGRLADIIDDLHNDPDWKERIEILERSDTEQSSTPPTEEELTLMLRLEAEYAQEMLKREKDEREYQSRQLEAMTNTQVLDEYTTIWVERRGTTVATSEYILTEIWYATRVCDAVRDSDGTWNHDACNGHRERVFESKQEVRGLPEALQALLRDSLAELTMTVREAKNSDRQGNSSDSSPLPSEPAESTPSTSNETQDEAPGTSAKQLVTA